MSLLTRADCFRIALWFVGEEEFHPSERLLIQMPFGDGVIRAALSELRNLTTPDAANTGADVLDFAKPDLLPAIPTIRKIRRFCVPGFVISRVRTLLGDIRGLNSTISLRDSLFGLLQASDLFRDEKSWRALEETLKQVSAGDYDERVRRIVVEVERATAMLQAWYDLQDHLKRPPFAPGTLPLAWTLDRRLLSRLQGAIETYQKCAGDLLSPEECAVLEESKAAFAELDLPRPHWSKLRDVVGDSLRMLMAVKPSGEAHLGRTKIDDVRAILERAATHLQRFVVPQEDAEISEILLVLSELQAELGGYLAEEQTECGDAVRAQLAKCLEVAQQFLCTVPAPRSLTVIENDLREARSGAPGRVEAHVCGLVVQLQESYQRFILACREQWKQRALTAADDVRTLIAAIRKATTDEELCRLCDSVECLLNPLAKYQETYERLKRLNAPPRAATFSSLTKSLDGMVQTLQRRTGAKIARVECRLGQLLPLALDPEPLECLLLALAEFREAVSRDVVDALRSHGDDICDWRAVYQPAFDSVQFAPPTGDDYCDVREALAMLRPAEIAKRLKATHPDQPLPEHTLRLMEDLAEYEAGLDALGVFLAEYTKHVSFLDSVQDPTAGPGEFERFSGWLNCQNFRFPPPPFSPWPYADFAAWLIALPVSQQADVLRVMLIGPWSDVIDSRARQLIEEKPSIFTAEGDHEANQAAKRRALLFLIHALATYRPFDSIRQLWETICPPHYRRILPNGSTILEHMLEAVENATAAWRSARAAGAPNLPVTYTTGMAVVNSWNYLLGDERLSKQIAEGKLRRRSRRAIAAQYLLESVFAGPAIEILETLCREPYTDLEASLSCLLPRIERFYGSRRRAAWAGFLIHDIMDDVSESPENRQRNDLSPEEKRKKRAENRRRHSRIKAEEEIFIGKIEDLLHRLHEALTSFSRKDGTLWAQYGLLRKTLSMYRWREKTISELRREKRQGSPGPPTCQVGVLERRAEKAYASLYRIANQIAASYPYLADQARGAGLPGLARCLERAGRAMVDLVYGFVRGRHKRHSGDTGRANEWDSRPRGLQYLIMRKWMDDDDGLLDELLDPPG